MLRKFYTHSCIGDEQDQGRNFGVKVEGTNSEGERGALWSPTQDERGGGIPSASDWGIWDSVSFCSGFRDRAATGNGFIVI